MILDCIPFLNELDLLELRLKHLRGVADLHLVVEATMTFSGLPKPLYFENNKERFEDFPIKYVVVDNMPTGRDPWVRDSFQKQVAWKEAQKLKPEICLVTDLDEIPSLFSIEAFKSGNFQTVNLIQDMLLFYFDRLDTSLNWDYAKITRDMQNFPVRGDRSTAAIEDGGWHLEYFGKREVLLEKINATAHANEPGGRDFYAKVKRGNLDGLQRTVEYPFEMLPKVVRDNFQHYADLGFFSPGYVRA